MLNFGQFRLLLSSGFGEEMIEAVALGQNHVECVFNEHFVRTPSTRHVFKMSDGLIRRCSSRAEYKMNSRLYYCPRCRSGNRISRVHLGEKKSHFITVK